MDFNTAFYLTSHWWIAAGIAVLLLIASETGWRIGRGVTSESNELRPLVGNVAGATLGLLGLLLGFALSMAIARWDARRDVIVNEVNAIGTLWLRASLVDEPLRGELRGELRAYTDTRAELFEAFGPEAVQAVRAKSERLHGEIWSTVERITRSGAGAAVVSSLIASANEVIDLHELRLSSLENYLPAALILLLAGVAAIALGFLGWSFGAAAARRRGALLLLVLLITSVLAVIMDVNRPHRGLFRIGGASLIRLRESIAPDVRP